MPINDGVTHTADQLAAEGRRLSLRGHLIVFLYPSQEWMAVQQQMLFRRYEKMPSDANLP